ncbi:MAG: hypothetical protein R2851_18480 [Caldilineaceae bacterium]
MVDIAASSNLEDNLELPFAPWLYTISCMHCMAVSLAHDGAAGRDVGRTDGIGDAG